MKIYLLMILIFEYIECMSISGTYDKNMLLSSYITPKNDMLIYNPRSNSLYKYTIN